MFNSAGDFCLLIVLVGCFISLRTLNYGNYGIFLIMDNAGFISSTVRCLRVHVEV